MYLNKIQTDRHCWISNTEIEFAPRVNMIFGKSGSGKSRLIETIHNQACYESNEMMYRGLNAYSIACYNDIFLGNLRFLCLRIEKHLNDELCADQILRRLNIFMDGLNGHGITDIFKHVTQDDIFRINNVDIFVYNLRILPSSQRRLLLMVIDMAMFSYLASNSTDFKGVVFIDDIDLYLDIELQESVMERFVKTFPNAQFVVSTRSPIILSQLPQNGDSRIFQIIRDGQSYTLVGAQRIFGMDYNSVVSMVMGAHARDPHVKEVKERYIRLMRRGKTDKAIDVALEIKRLFPNDYKDIIKELDSQV